jgi:flagellar motor switch protein FliN
MSGDDTLNLPDLADPGAFNDTVPAQHDTPDLERNSLELAPVYDVPVHIKAVLGRATMEVAELLKMGSGSLIELDRRVGEAIDIYVNNRLVARGELVVVDDRLGVTMTEIIKDGDTV